MSFNKWHNLSNLDECVQNMALNIGAGKLHVKNPSEKWGWLGGKSFRTFLCRCFLLFLFYVSIFLTLILLRFQLFLTLGRISGKKLFWGFLYSITKNCCPDKIFWEIPGEIHFWWGLKLPSGNLTFKLSYLADGFQRLCLKF